MCGIAGFLGPSRDAERVLHNMCDAIIHRGPDGEGYFVDGPAALGHRRLKIIDLTEDAAQPMQSADGRFVLTYNGEIYNFQELREELARNGFTFRSAGDTEVVLCALSHWGVEALKRFNGMFALVLWDRQSKRLLLARDRYGIKPLYYARSGAATVFASEIKAIVKFPGLNASLDQAGLLEYFTFQNFFSDRTLFEGIRTFPAGHYMQVAMGEDPMLVQYWDFEFREPDNDTTADAEYIEELDRLFNQAIRRQLVSDVAVGAFLSGGVDSGSISAVASRYYPELRSFTVGFEAHSGTGLEAGFSDERAVAEALSSLYDTEHYQMVLKSGDMERAMPAVVRHIEEPRVGQSYPNYYAAKLAKGFSTVALSGAGGDELFAGYPWRYYRAVVNTSFDDYLDKYYLFWQRLIPNRIIHQVFHPIWNNVRDIRTRDIMKSVFRKTEKPTTPQEYVNSSLYFEAKTFLHGLFLVDDKLSMAHSLEMRVPFMDNDLVDFAMRVPLRLKLGNLDNVVRLDENEIGPKTEKYFERTRDGKLILRRCMGKYVPADIAEGVKRGFSGPDDAWFRGRSIEYVRKTLLKKSAPIYEVFDYAAISTLVNEHLTGAHNRRLLIWSLLTFDQWCKEFLN
jgi:asparagine synthase (glutamine-hydrolysing)